MLLTLGSEEERVALLPDCFTPPASEPAEGTHDTHEDSAQQWQQQPGQAAGGAPGHPTEEGEPDAGETDELWCTPAQLLNELDARLRQVTQARQGGLESQQNQRQLGVVEGQLVGGELGEALQGLRLHVHAFFMQTMTRQQQQK